MRRPLFTVALCLVFFCAIRLWTGGADEEWSKQMVTAGLQETGPWTITGQVYQKEEEFIYLKSIIISKSSAFGQSAAESRQDYSGEVVSGKIICEVDEAVKIPLGTVVVVRGTFAPFLGATNPGTFDARKYYRSIGIMGKLEDGVLLGRGERYWPVREWLYSVKSTLSQRIYAVFSEEDAPVIEALLLGEKGNLDSDLKGLYKRNGILHILSISAMHVSIVGMSIYQMLRKAGVPIWLSAVCGSVILLLYGALTGFGISAVRAIGMYLIRMLGETVGRTYDMLTSLGLVGVLMVLYHPYYLENGGFLLSFSCVLGIGVLYPLLLPDYRQYQGGNRALDTPWKKLRERLRETEFPRRGVSSFVLSLSVTLATLPVQLYLYYEVPIYSVFLNLLVIPFLKPMMLSGIVALMIPGSVVFEGVVSIILGWYEVACEYFDVLPFNTWNPGCPKNWQMLVYYGLLLAVICWRRRVKRQEKQEEMEGKNEQKGKIKWTKHAEPESGYPRWMRTESGGKWVHRLGCGTMLGLGIVILGMHPLQSSITFLDVGQGSCAVMELSSGENYLFDCGSSGRSKVGEYVLLPYLKYAGIRRLDGVFVSHPDEDHSNGVLELFGLRNVNDIIVEQLILPDIEDEASEEQLGELVHAATKTGQMDGVMQDERRRTRATRVAYISEGDAWQCEGAVFRCLHPYKDYSGADSNQYSQCIYVEFLERKWFGEAVVVQSLLLTGDVGKEAERDLVKVLMECGIEDVTVFQGAHHGSKYSNSVELLEIVHPEVTVISCGQNNSYGHPHRETLERLENVGSAVLTTPEFGAIKIEMKKEIKVYGYGR